MPVYEDGQYKSGKDNRTGTPQGGVISPLLANIYFHLIDRIVNNTKSLFGKFGIRIVRYADDSAPRTAPVLEADAMMMMEEGPPNSVCRN